MGQLNELPLILIKAHAGHQAILPVSALVGGDRHSLQP